MLDSMLLCRYEKMVRPQGLQWQAWTDDHWNRAWNGMARFEKQPDMLSRPFDIAQIALVCVLGYADFRFADCGWRKAYPKLDAFHRENAGAAFGEDLGAAAGVTSSAKRPHATTAIDHCGASVLPPSSRRRPPEH